MRLITFGVDRRQWNKTSIDILDDISRTLVQFRDHFQRFIIDPLVYTIMTMP